jgi:predicted transcriptional regulator
MLFHKAHLARAVVLFNELKYRLEQKALAAIKSGGACVTDEEFEQLEKLQEEVNKKRETLEAIQSRLRPNQRVEEVSTIAARHKHQQESSEALTRLKSMRV